MRAQHDPASVGAGFSAGDGTEAPEAWRVPTAMATPKR